MGDDIYVSQLKAERENIDPSFTQAIRLLDEEIERVEKRGRYTVIHEEKECKVLEKVLIPVIQYPKHNFVGKLLGPQGNTLKSFQLETGSKISILGRGSMKDKKKEEELRKEGDPKNNHLNQDLHLVVEISASPREGHLRMARVLKELEKFLIPGNEQGEEIRQQQMLDWAYLNGGEAPQQPAPRGVAPPLLSSRSGPHHPAGMRGRGGPGMRGRGAAGPPPASRGALGFRGRGAPARGIPTRGAILRGTGSRYNDATVRRVARPPPQPVYEEESYGAGYDEAAYDAYGAESYENSYGGSASDSQYYDYGHVSTRDGYDEYGAGEAGYGGQNGYKQSPYKPLPVSSRTARGNGRVHPYVTSGRGARY